MLINPSIEQTAWLWHGIAVIIIIILRVARCNDRIRRPIPGTP
jgi:hypothetical protein